VAGTDRVRTSGPGAGVLGLRVDLGGGQGVGVTTATTLSTSTSTAGSGQSVALTATVSSAAGVPTGFVIFSAGGGVQGTAPVDANGVATLTVPPPLRDHPP